MSETMETVSCETCGKTVTRPSGSSGLCASGHEIKATTR